MHKGGFNLLYAAGAGLLAGGGNRVRINRNQWNQALKQAETALGDQFTPSKAREFARKEVGSRWKKAGLIIRDSALGAFAGGVLERGAETVVKRVR